MQPQTLDVYPDEMLLMMLMLSKLIDEQNTVLRDAQTDNEAEQARARIDIATRLRGKLPLVISHDEDFRIPE